MRKILVLMTLSGPALAQEFAFSNTRVSNGVVTAIFGPPRPAPVVTDAPYSAEHRLQQIVIGRYARDS